MNPEFQRRHRWNNTKRSRLIESFIMNVPIPPIFLYEQDYSKYEVMDGLQRLTTITMFYTNQFQLEGLEEWHELNGLTYEKLPEKVRHGIDRRFISSIILLQETAKDKHEAERLKQMVFERINSGGEKLEPQESRNAIYNGPLNRLCLRLSRTPSFCRMWSIPEPTESELSGGDPPPEATNNIDYRKMHDVELALRFFAYRQRLLHDHSALDKYLNTFLRHGNVFSEDILTACEEMFISTMDLIEAVLGNTAFWLYRRRGQQWLWRQRPTKVVYDPLSYVFCQHRTHAKKNSFPKPTIYEEKWSLFTETATKALRGAM
jgi:hypothetical protein